MQAEMRSPLRVKTRSFVTLWLSMPKPGLYLHLCRDPCPGLAHGSELLDSVQSEVERFMNMALDFVRSLAEEPVDRDH